MHVALPPQLAQHVSELMQSSGYSDHAEIIAEALREQQSRRQIAMTPELARLLDEGLENLDQAKTTEELRRA